MYGQAFEFVICEPDVEFETDLGDYLAVNGPILHRDHDRFGSKLILKFLLFKTKNFHLDYSFNFDIEDSL